MKKATAILLFLSLIGSVWLIKTNQTGAEKQVLGETKDKYQEFVGEVYSKIQTNYWEKISDQELSNLFLLATDKVTNRKNKLNSQDKKGVLELVKVNENKETVSGIVDVVMANLKPFGRSRLYSLKEEKALTDNVNNISPGSDYFSQLGVGKSATDKEIINAYEKSKKTPEIKQAYKVLAKEDSRKVYAATGVEPTIEYKLMAPSIYYVHMTKFSPTSLSEFVNVMNKVEKMGSELDTLIFDLRGNIGGAIDGLPYFLGPFIGADNYAYQFYQQGKKEDFKTMAGWLDSMVRYKKVVILIDENSQSTAEVMAGTLKTYNVGVLVGTTTKGWGTVEKVLNIDHQIANSEKFSLFLVHHITLRDDGQPIEGRGVEPMISIKSPAWKKDLQSRFGNVEIVKAVEEIYKGI